MIQAVTEAEQEVYRGGGPVRDSIGPKYGSENSSKATGLELPGKSIKSTVAPNRAMFPYWLMKKKKPHYKKVQSENNSHWSKKQDFSWATEKYEVKQTSLNPSKSTSVDFEEEKDPLSATIPSKV